MSDAEFRCRHLLFDLRSLRLWEEGRTPEVAGLEEELARLWAGLTGEERQRLERLREEMGGRP